MEWGQKCVLTPKKLREIKVGWPLLKFPRMGCGVRVLSLLTYTPLKTDRVFLIYKCNKDVS